MAVLALTFPGLWAEGTRSEHFVHSLARFSTPNRHVVHLFFRTARGRSTLTVVVYHRVDHDSSCGVVERLTSEQCYVALSFLTSAPWSDHLAALVRGWHGNRRSRRPETLSGPGVEEPTLRDRRVCSHMVFDTGLLDSSAWGWQVCKNSS